MTVKTRIESPIFLSEGKVTSFSDLLNIFLEYCLFFRWIYFKNRPRGNLLFVRSMMAIGVYFTTYTHFFGDWKLMLLGIDIDPMLGLGICAALGYWNMSHVFYRKSETAAEIYTQIMTAKGSGHFYTEQLLTNNLCLQLLTMDLWAHRLYDGLFAQHLEQAIQNTIPPERQNQLYDSIQKGQLQAKEAREILSNYRLLLWQKDKKLN